MRRLGLLLALAACHPSGLTLEVVIDDPNIKKVELFAGTHCSGDCPRGTAPPALPAMPVDDAYLVADEVPWTVSEPEFDGGVAGFRIESTLATSLDILVVVGYDADDQIRWSRTFHGVDIPADDAAHWRVQLSPTTPIAVTPAAPPPGSERVARWQQPSQRLPACLLLEHWGSSGTAARELVVPDGDRDCDEVALTSECAPWIPNAVGAPPSIEEARCVLPAPLPGNPTPVCMLGGPSCDETASTPSDSCVPLDQTYCTSSALCACAGTPDIAACVTDKIATGIDAKTMPYLHCTIQLDTDGTSCKDVAIEADAGAYVSGGTTQCRGMGLHPATTPFEGFAGYLELDATSKLKIDAFTQPCKAALFFAGSSTPHSQLALAALELDNDNHVVIPLRIDLEQTGCVEDSHCEFYRPSETVFDAVWQCVGASNAPRCTPDTNQQCAGPVCNGLCCAAGEYCGPLGCSCGTDGTRCHDGDTCQSAGPMQSDCGTICCGVTTPCPQ